MDAFAAARRRRRLFTERRSSLDAPEMEDFSSPTSRPVARVAKTPLGKPRRVPMTPEDAAAYDTAEARLDRRRAAAASAEDAIARALAHAGATTERPERGSDADPDRSDARARRASRTSPPPPPSRAAAVASRAREDLRRVGFGFEGEKQRRPAERGSTSTNASGARRTSRPRRTSGPRRTSRPRNPPSPPSPDATRVRS